MNSRRKPTDAPKTGASKPPNRKLRIAKETLKDLAAGTRAGRVKGGGRTNSNEGVIRCN